MSKRIKGSGGVADAPDELDLALARLGKLLPSAASPPRRPGLLVVR